MHIIRQQIIKTFPLRKLMQCQKHFNNFIDNKIKCGSHLYHNNATVGLNSKHKPTTIEDFELLYAFTKEKFQCRSLLMVVLCKYDIFKNILST